MISLVVVASIATKWLLPEDDSRLAQPLRAVRLFAPDLLIAECTNALWRRVTMGDLAPTLARDGISRLAAVGVELIATLDDADRALELSLILGHPAYDCFYLALAERLDVRLVTADKRLIAKLALHPALSQRTWSLSQAAAAIGDES